MSSVDPSEIDAILQRVRARFGSDGSLSEPAPPAPAFPGSKARPAPIADSEALGILDTVDAAVAAAEIAYQEYDAIGLDGRFRLIQSIRQAMERDAAELARMAHEETGLGRPEDKEKKNLLVARKTPGPEDLTPKAVTGDRGMTVTEFAPWGVIAAITPTTNPTATIINNTIATLSAGNSLVFNAHPSAKRVSAENVRRINRAVLEAGGPANLVCAVPEPTIESAQQLMNHPGVRVLLVTGGPGVVKEALNTDKKAITAGPGNPPVLVDESADIERAAREIIRGASFDNNMVCTDEKETFVVRSKADELLRAFGRDRAVVLKEYQLQQLERVIFRELGAPERPGKINPKWIGQNAGRILREIGVEAGNSVRLVVVEVPKEHSLVWTEQMMPVMPVVRVGSVNEGIDLSVRAEHGYRHTASIYSNNVENITRMARAMKTSIFVANAANIAGLGEGGEDFTSFSIATPTGEGLTRPRTFARIRRLTVAGSLRIV
ncbi:MAG: aldehyde dehydrogenase EutE [bacterium]|nr:aldehyde dehydrogenase EutE [bacterium]